MANKKQTVLDQLQRVRSVGPTRAETLYDEHDIRSLEDLVALGESGQLTEISGVGKKKAATIISSAKRLASANGADQSSPTNAKEPGKTSAKKSAKKTTKKSAQKTAKKSAQKTAKKSAKEQPKRSPSASPRTGDKAAAGANGRARRAEKQPPTPPSTAGTTGAAGAQAAPRTSDQVTPSSAADKKPLRQRFIATLRCPACGHDRFDQGASTLTCQACQRQFNFRNGIVDLAPPVPSDRSLSQKVMESRFYAQFYEDLMRPRLTNLISNRTMRDEYRLAAEFLELDDDTRLLDVGCGTANFTRYFAQRIGLTDAAGSDRPTALVAGMDLSWSMLDQARRNLRQENLADKVFLIRGDGTRIPVRRGAYNRLHCGGALHMMNDIDEGLRNFARVLSPQGICVIGTFILGKGLLRRFAKRAAEFPTRFHWFSRDELHRRVERAGFEILDDSVAGDAITVKARRI